jgi:hypothetical protein
MQTMRDQILARIRRFGKGKAFSAKDFRQLPKLKFGLVKATPYQGCLQVKLLY